MTVTKNWQELAESKKNEVNSKIPEEWVLPVEVTKSFNEKTPSSVLHIPKQYLSVKEFEITENYNAEELVKKIASSTFSAVDVIKAFSHRAAIATQLTNCCTELMLDYGIKRAKYLDEYLKTHSKPIGPLHGLPISLKDSFNIPGYDSTLGFVCDIGKKATEESDLVRLLLDLGANFYVKTNIPQTLMTGDSENNIFGRTLNPNNLTWTAGGSSGGEGALIKMRGSILGMGTDVAGSIRIPALCNGVYSYRPTGDRYPMGKQAECSRDVFVGVLAVAGPLAVDAESLEFITKLVYNQKPWDYDSSMLRINYQNTEITAESKLKIGVILEDPDLPVHPPIKRIIKQASDKLIESGHSVEFIKFFPSYDKSWEIAWQLFQVDENATAFAKLQSTGERIIDSLLLPGMDVYGNGPKDIDTLIKLKTEVNNINIQWSEIFKNFDVIIAPGSPSTAPPHDEYGIAPYTTAWNVVDFPAIIVPFGKSDAKIDVDDHAEYSAKLKSIYAHYRPENYDQAPGHVQIVAPRLEDEKLLACTLIIDKALNPK
jgi:amidase